MNPLTRIASLSLRAKLTIGLLVAAVLVVIVAVFAADQYKLAIEPSTNLLVRALAEERASTLNGILAQTIRPVEYLSHTTADKFAALAATPDNAASRQEIERAFRTMLNDYPVYRQVRFVSLGGTVLVSVPNARQSSDVNEDYYKALSSKQDVQPTYISPFRQDQGDAYSVDFVHIPDVNGKPLGYLVVTVDPAGTADPASPSLFSALKIVSQTAGNVIFYLVDQNGAVLSPVIRPAAQNPVTTASAQQLAVPPTGQITTYFSPVFSALATGFNVPISQLKANLVAEIRTVQFLGSEEAGTFNLKLAVILAIGALVLGLVALFIDTTIVTPTRRLLKAAANVAQGRPADIQPLRQRDEIGGLYTAFNTLTSQLTQDIRVLESSVAQRTRDIEATRDIGQIISSIRELDPLLQAVVELIRERFTDVYHAQVFLVDPTGKDAVLRTSTGEAGQKLLARGHRLAVGSQSVIGQVAAQGQPIVALNTSTSKVHKANELLPDTRAELALPLRTTGGVIGALDLQSKRAEAFTEADIQLFQTIADQLTIAITNARLFAEAQARVSEIEELNRRLIGQAWQDYTTSRRPEALVGTTGNGSAHWSEWQRRAIETGDTVEHPGETVVTFAVPIRLRGQVIGAAEWDVPRANYGANSRQLAQELANRLAIIADNVRSFDQAQRLAQREHLVSDIASKLTQQTDVSQILQIAVKELGQALRVPQTSIRLAANRDATPTDAE
ncbi:MAG: GAF domain-containing protein [Anaerolineae bacterium]|nr:GAF domain-containing protein [Anaerolineae bacterium]